MEETEENDRLSRLKRKQKLRDEYASALDGNATLSLAGYDHLESPDFYRRFDLLDEKYLKKAEPEKKEKKDGGDEKDADGSGEGKAQ